MVLFQCTHTTIHQNLAGCHVRFVQKGIDVEASHGSIINTARAMAKAGPCMCAEAWGKLRLLRKAPQ